MKKGHLIVLSGPSGSGKSTIVKRLCDKHEHMLPSISATTRAPRGDEKHGVHYFFMSNEEFLADIKAGKFFEYAEVHSKRYGTPKAYIENQLLRGNCILLDIDVQGAMQIKAANPAAKLIFIKPPSDEVLRQRLVSRATDSKKSIEERLDMAKYEMTYAKRYDVTVVNDDLNQTVANVEKIICDYITE